MKNTTADKIKKRAPAAGIPIKRLTPAPKAEPLEPEEFLENVEPTADEVADAEKLDTLRDMFGGRQYTLRVQRYNDETSEMEIVDRYDFDTFDPFIMAKKYGGGKFVCTLFNDKGKYVEGGRLHFNFAKTIEPQKQTSPLSDPTVIAFVESLKANQAMLMEVLKTSLTGEKQTPIDQLVNALKGMKEISGGDEKRENPMKNLKELLELQVLLKDSGGGDDDKGGSGVLSEIVEAFKVLKTTQPPRAQIPNGRPQPRPNGNLPIIPKVESPAPDVPPVPEESKLIEPVKKLLFYVPKFEDAAVNNRSPERWAGILLDILEEETVPGLVKHFGPFATEDIVWEKLLEAVHKPEMVGKIFETAPALVPHQAWVIDVLNHAVKQFEDEPEAEPSTTLNGDQN